MGESSHVHLQHHSQGRKTFHMNVTRKMRRYCVPLAEREYCEIAEISENTFRCPQFALLERLRSHGFVRFTRVTNK